MTTARLGDLVSGLRRGGDGPTDAYLLDRYLTHQDAAAIAAVVRRHGPMVWGVCRRLLAHHHAEDAFQATFLVLVRKAATISAPNRLANWLYGVAYQTARKARAVAARRAVRERQGADMHEPASRTPADGLDEVLDAELSRLPDIYRTAVVLCELEGRTRKEAARLLNVPEGTLAARLARGRQLLAKRLARLGLGSAAVLAARPAVAVPPAVLSGTVHALTTLAAGSAEAAFASGPAAALANQVLRTMLLTKLRTLATGCVAVLALLGLGVSSVAGPTDQPRVKPPAVPKVQKPGPLAGKIVLFGVQGPKPGQAIVALDPAVFTADGVDADALTKAEVLFTAPAGSVIPAGRVSPDGRTLAFNMAAADDTKRPLWALEPGAAEAAKLADDALVQAWSPDGRSLLCTRGFDPDKHESFVLDLTRPARPMERTIGLPGRDWAGDWSPDGKGFAVTTYPEKQFHHPRIPGPYPLRQVYLCDQDGTKGTALSADPMHDDILPRFSPDGKRVGFGQRRHQAGGICYSLMVVGRDGKGAKELVDLNALAKEHGWDDLRENSPPCWSPDGKTVVWVALGRVADKRGAAKPTPGTLTPVLVFATPEAGFQKLVKACDLGFSFVGSADWR